MPVSALDPDIIKVRKAIKEAVAGSSSNIEVGIFGSHVDGKNFISPLKGGSSDFDMRLIFKNVAPDDAEAIGQWQKFRENLRQALGKQYPDEGDLARILDKVNVYPPEELMKGVNSRTDALWRFKQLNISPKLSHQSAQDLNKETFKELAGGLYGETTEKATRQGFESKVGKVIGKDANGAVKEFLADITHKAEGEGIYTVKGSGNAAAQWLDDAISALEKGNAKGIAKNVQRANILNKGKDLARVPLKESDIALKNAAKEMEDILEEFGEEALEGEKLALFEKRVSEVVSKYGLQDILKICKIDAELLKKFGNPKFEGLIVDGLLRGVGKWGKLRSALGQLWSKVPEGSVPAVLNVIILTFEAPEQYQKEGALKAAFESALGLLTLQEAFGPLGWAQLASTITVSILDLITDYFKDRIYEFTAGSQSCSDLIAGRYTVKGRESQLVDPMLEGKCHNVQDINELACYTTKEDVVLRLIECHARNAAKRFEGGEAGEQETMKGIIDALMKKCGRDGQNLGSVLQDWAGTRESFKTQLDDFIRNFEGRSLKLEARPDPAQIDNNGPVTVRFVATIDDFSEKKGKDILKCLGGQDSVGYVYPKYKWGVNGILKKETSLPYVDLDFDKAGDYLIDMAVEIEYGSSSTEVKGGYLSKGGQFPLTVFKKDQSTSKDSKKDDLKGQTTTPPVIPVTTQPDSYTQGQIGIGKKPGDGSQTGPTGKTDTTTFGKTDDGKSDAGKSDTDKTETGKLDSGKTDIGKTDIGKTDMGKTDSTTTTKTDTSTSTKTPPTCTYKYSEWSECNRGTKKQTRTLIGKEPAGCVETGKPVLEQSCTPPPTEEEKRNGYLNCLCRCYTHWAGHIGVFYAPTGYQDCGGSGPCVGGIGAFGNCDRSFFGPPNDCAKGCYEGAYGKGSYDEKTADKIRKEVNNKFKKPLKLKVNEGKCPLKAQLGEIVNLTAVTEGGIPPHKFSWTGDGQAKDNTFTFANTREPGPHPISVTVTDDEGKSVTASCQVIVDAVTVKIELLDKERKIPIGESRNFKGTVMSGDKQASGNFYFLWQPHPEIQFSPFEKTGGSESGTKATFNKIGKFKIWVIAHTYQNNIKKTVGESEQIEIEVAKPELKLSFQPSNPKVGQEVKLTVAEKPKMDDKAISFWWEKSGNTLNAGPLKNEREYTFRPKDNKPVTITVHGKAKDGGDDLGEAKATITAQSYEVKLGEPHHLPPKPRIWKCNTQLGGAKDCGIVELEKELAVFNDIFIKASVTPEPEKPPLKYAWSVTPEGRCGLPGAGQELKMNCSEPGSYTASVTVRDSQDVILGTASTPVGITVTKEDLDKGKKPMVILKSDKTALKIGETANIQVVVQGGKSPFTYKWSEGIEGKGEAVKFVPKKSGPQKISVDLKDASGQTNAAVLDLKVEAAKLELTLKADKPSVKIGEKVSFKATLKGGEPEFTYKWSDGVEGKGEAGSFTPKKSGAQKLSLEVSDGKGQKATANVEIKVTPAKLEATLKADKLSLKTGEAVRIKADVKGGEPPLIYKWSDGVEGKEEAGSFTPKKSGMQKVTLEITDAAKQKATADVSIKVEPLKLELMLKAEKTTIKTGENITIKAEVKGGEPPFSYKWGPEVAGKGESAQLTPKKSGIQKVNLEVSDATKQKATASMDIKVEPPKLEVTLTADKGTRQVGEPIGIKAEVKGGEPLLTYKWSEGVVGKGTSVQFTPKNAGTQNISLEVSDAAKQKSTANLQIKVDPPKLEVALKADKSPLKTGETANIMAAVKGGKTPYTYTWSNQVSGNGESVRFSPKSSGFYKIYVEVRDGDQKKATGNLDLTVQEGKIESKTADTKSGETKTSISQEAGATKQVIEPVVMKLAPGENGIFKAYEINKAGRKVEIPSSKVSWKIDPYRGATIDKNGKVSVNKSAKSGAPINVTALFEKAQANGSLEIVSASSISTTSSIKETIQGTKMLQPDPLQLTPGSSGLITLLEKDSQAKIISSADVSNLTWKLETNLRDISLKPQKDGVAVITAKNTIKVGTKIKVLALSGKSQVSGTIEIIPSQTTEKGKEQQTALSTITKDQAKETDKASGQQGYTIYADPSLKSEKSTLDTAKMDKLKTDFQDSYWSSQSKKTQTSSTASQQNVQQQPVDYTQPKIHSTQTQTANQPPLDTTKTSADTSKTTTDTTKATTDTTKTTAATQTAAKTGLEVQVVGAAPTGKCLIVEGQLVPVKGYKENIANMTVTLTGPVTQSVTSSAKGTFKFPEIPAGNYIISVKQWNYGMTKQNFVAPSGKSVKIILKGSCPFLYVWTGEKFEKENDIFSVARLRPQELLPPETGPLAGRDGLFLSPVSLGTIPEKLKKEKSLTDYYPITRSLKTDKEGKIRLKIVEQDGEHSFTDRVRLIAVDHHRGSRIGITRQGRPFMYKDRKPLGDIQIPVSLYNEEILEIKLPVRSSQEKILIIKWQGFQEGNPQNHNAAAVQPKLALQRMNPQGIWQTMDWIYPRDEIQESFFILEERGPGWDREGKIRLTATSCDPEKFHRLDSLSLARLIPLKPRLTHLELLSAKKSTGEKMVTALSKSDNQYLSLGPEESVELKFQSLPLRANGKRSYIFVSEGFYIPLPAIRLTSN